MSISKRTKKSLLIICVTFLLLAVVVAIISHITGGISNIRKNLTSLPDPEGSTITTARLSAEKGIKKELADISSRTGLSPLATDTLDECYKGKNISASEGGFAHMCTYRMTQYFGYNGDFAMQTLQYFKSLDTLGWDTAKAAYSSSIMKTYNAYRDQPTGTESAMLLNGDQTANKNDLSMTITYQDISNASALASSATDHQDVLDNATATIEFKQKDASTLIKVIQAASDKFKYFLSISIQKDYFQN